VMEGECFIGGGVGVYHWRGIGVCDVVMESVNS
jgi:hypothetical protein